MGSSMGEIEDQPLVVSFSDDQVASKKPVRSYTRDFLLSLSALEVCKKLPDGFDESLLSEFEESSHGTYDRPRAGSGFRRSDYGSSGPARGDSGSFSRGPQRWDSRSSGKSDTDTDSESGRRYGSQTRKSGQVSEHDGLLGRPSGFTAGVAVPRFRPNSNIPLNKSNEPYHPPRPYKAGPPTRRETNDSFNDETFGSADSTSEDRVEEEKKRRVEFELMRKEQQKALQQKQKSNPGKLDDPFSDITGNPAGNVGPTDVSSKHVPHDDVSKPRVTSSAPPFRPLVPPGFVNSVVDKTSTSSKLVVHSDQLEVKKTESKETNQDFGTLAEERGLSEPKYDSSGLSASMSEKTWVPQAAEQLKTSDHSDMNRLLENGDVEELDSTVTGPKLLGNSGRSTSILEKLFGNAVVIDSSGTSNSVEDHGAKTDDIWSPTSGQSKFAPWFIEEDMNQNMANSSDIHANQKPIENTSPKKSNDLLSLIVGGEKPVSEVSDARVGHLNSDTKVSSTDISEQFISNKAVDPNPTVLTCEDLEQSMLSGIGGNDSQENHVLDVKVENPSVGVDNQASKHLMSLLQKGTSPQKPNASDDNIGSGDVEGLSDSGKTLTLESLFGTAFMTELHSAQRSSVGPTGVDPANEVDSNFGMSSSSNASVTVVDKLANFGLNGQDPVLVSGPRDVVKPELPYYRQATSPILHGPLMDRPVPFPHHDPHMKLLNQDGMIHHDVPRHHHDIPMHLRYHGNVYPPNLHHSGGLPGFDHHFSPVLPPMHNASNLPPVPGPVHEFPFGGQRQSNFGNPRMASPGHERNNPPEAFQRLMEMELRANPEQIFPPFGGGGPSRAMYGHDVLW